MLQIVNESFLHTDGLRPTPMTMTTPRRTSGGRRAEFSASSSLAVACENAEVSSETFCYNLKLGCLEIETFRN